MDEQLQAKIDEAKAAGYSDEEIQQFLATKDKPIAEEQPHERGAEYGGTAMSALPAAVEVGAVGYGIKKAAEAFRGAPAVTPVQPGSLANATKTLMTPSNPQPALNPTWDNALKQPVNQGPSMMERGTQYAKEMQRIAAEKVMQGARAMAPAAQAVGGAARAVAPAALGIGAALYPSSTGPSVPQSGPMRGMEINPNTGRPWTEQELAQLR